MNEDEAKGNIVMGIFILMLTILMWRLTHNIFGWFLLFILGSYCVLYGIWQAFMNDE